MKNDDEEIVRRAQRIVDQAAKRMLSAAERPKVAASAGGAVASGWVVKREDGEIVVCIEGHCPVTISDKDQAVRLLAEVVYACEP